MKTRNLIVNMLLLLAVLTGACKKEKIERPDFDATVAKTTFKVGEPVVFSLKGNPDFVSFYSGEYLNDYDYTGGRTLDIKSFSLSFQTRVQNGNQKDQFSVYLSSDFNGKYDIESIRSGNFQNITNLVTLSTVNTVYAPSGVLDLTTLVKDRTKPLYVAFKYVVKPQDAVNGTQRNWYVRDLVLNTVTELGQSAAIDQLTAAWTLVESGSILEAGRNTITASTGLITFRGNATTEGKAVATEAWVVSKAVDLNTVILGPDKSVPVKSISDTMPPVYNYVYTKPGTYKVVFATANNRINGKKELLKELTITVAP
ncbi:DUF5017 domain-containing protein [Pedobacter sp. PWIIR3]